ncbi:TIR domain-containing protein [Streptomyces xylophagus]|uniref:TIR domain-containing protein n=1 Tax=Streptomyces xylophagus TaxID=285514 RepID=UPI0005BCEF7A|nr:TIR domain-containing protein [Streptomyces xylophagus]
MHEIFVNYRTKSGKEVAYSCDRALSARFGPDSVFLARKSIDPGNNYIDVLVRAARRSHVLLALVDEEWIDAPDRNRPGRRALDNPQDWVRRELEEALAAGVLIVPLFLGRRVEQLDPRRLPRSIAEIAECQYTRVDQHSLEADLTRLGDRLVRLVPALAALDRATPTDEPASAEPDFTVRNDHQSGGIGQVSGTVGTYVHDAHGPLNTGDGDQFNGTQINGDGTNHIAGDNQGGIRQGFGTRTPRGGEER